MRISFKRRNFEADAAWDCINDRGFLINEPPFSDVDKSVKNMYGPRSPKFGSEFSDASDFLERYRCKCGRYVGAAFEGETCPKCGTKIEAKGTDITYTAWLNFYPEKLINPLYYWRLQSALSKKVLEDIISNENIITSKGIMRKYDEEISTKKGALVYHNIGLHEFYKNYEEIMTYYKGKRKQKAELIDSLIEDKDLVWTSKIPVYSTALRPQGISSESYYFCSIDKQVNPLTNISINLRNANPIEVPLYLYQAQQRINQLWLDNFALIDGKAGWVRSNNLGGEFNFSGRNVIVLDPTLKIDEVDMSYKSFIELFKGDILKAIINDKGWTITKATNYLASRFNYDPYVYSVMQRLVHSRPYHIILNRNPTITVGSILMMKIRNIKEDSNDLSLAIPSAILPGLNADFQGLIPTIGVIKFL